MKRYKIKQKFPDAVAIIDVYFVFYDKAFRATDNTIENLEKQFKYIGSGVIFSIDGVLQKTNVFYHFCE